MHQGKLNVYLTRPTVRVRDNSLLACQRPTKDTLQCRQAAESAMALPVLGGLLISDEVVDLFLPVRFYWVRRARWLKLRAAKNAETDSTALARFVTTAPMEPAEIGE